MAESEPTDQIPGPEPTAEDLEAARQSLHQMGLDQPPRPAPGTPEYEARVKAVAGSRIRMGRGRFDLIHGLRQPRNDMEQALLENSVGLISKDELNARIRAAAPLAVELPLIHACFRAYEERLAVYSNMLQMIVAATTDQRDPQAWKRLEPGVDKCIAQLDSKMSLYWDELLAAHYFLRDLRAAKTTEPVRLGDFSAPTVLSLAERVLDRAVQGWRSCEKVAERSRRDPAYLYRTTASHLFFESHFKALPKPQEILALMELEEAAAAAQLRSRQQPAQPASTSTCGANRQLDGDPSSATATHDGHRYLFVCEGDLWHIRYEDKDRRLVALDGFDYISRLIAQANQRIAVEELITGTGKASSEAFVLQMESKTKNPAMDGEYIRQAREGYQELQAQLEKARKNNDEGTVEELTRQIGVLAETMASSRGLGGKSRNLNTAADRLRVRVQNAIGRARTRLSEQQLEALALHLKNNIHYENGSFCYSPNPLLPWYTGKPATTPEIRRS